MRKLDNPGNITTLTNPPFDITDDDSDDVVSMVTPTPGRDMLHDSENLTDMILLSAPD